jgi:hypothetical protein
MRIPLFGTKAEVLAIHKYRRQLKDCMNKLGYRSIVTILFLSLAAHLHGCAPMNGAGAVQGTTPESTIAEAQSGHLEFAFSGSRGAALRAGELERFIDLNRTQDLLMLPATATESPLAPCALLSAAKTAELANMMFWAVRQPHGIRLMYPLAGSNILGRYDSKFVRTEWTLSKIEPNKAADILARLVVFRSGGLSAVLNTFLSSMHQGECLELLANPERTQERMKAVDQRQLVWTHAAPVSVYIAEYSRENGHSFLDQLLEQDFFEKPNASKSNPFSPCAVLGTFRLAARLNDLWNNQLTKGAFDTANRPELSQYAEDIKGIPRTVTPSARMAEVFAAVFSAEIVRANELTARLTGSATENQCLEEVLEPGTIRKRLLKEGVELPLR